MKYSIDLKSEQVTDIHDIYESIEEFIKFVQNTTCEVSTENLERMANTLNYILDNLEKIG